MQRESDRGCREQICESAADMIKSKRNFQGTRRKEGLPWRAIGKYGGRQQDFLRFPGKQNRRQETFMEKIYRTMRNIGTGSIALGIVILAAGVTVGVLSIVNGALLLRRKNELTF